MSFLLIILLNWSWHRYKTMKLLFIIYFLQVFFQHNPLLPIRCVSERLEAELIWRRHNVADGSFWSSFCYCSLIFMPHLLLFLQRKPQSFLSNIHSDLLPLLFSACTNHYCYYERKTWAKKINKNCAALPIWTNLLVWNLMFPQGCCIIFHFVTWNVLRVIEFFLFKKKRPPKGELLLHEIKKRNPKNSLAR